MRRILLLSFFSMLCAGAFAQQEKITGVTINPDNSVTFRYRNPKAVTVEVSGEFMQGSAPLQEMDGVWTYTTPPLASEMYFYGLTVDGEPILDLNYSMVKDIPRWMNYFIIGGEKGDLYSVQDVPHGTVASRWYDSAMLRMRRRVNIYTPPGYENSKKSYPVFYLLHGNACDENSWLDLGRAAQIL
ncbi:MAG: esterase, partial [Bacteroidales bacterium]|nr:esterase [Bacteroidales bacterium]